MSLIFSSDTFSNLREFFSRYVKLSFLTTSDLQKVRRDLWAAVRRNKERMKAR